MRRRTDAGRIVYSPKRKREEKQMTKADIIDRVCVKNAMTKKAATAAVNAVFDALSEGLIAGERIWIPSFGTFEVRQHAARMGKNPSTGESIEIAACRAPAFKAGKTLKDAVNGERVNEEGKPEKSGTANRVKPAIN